MNLLQIVQALHREGRFTGSAPAAVAGLTGRAADLLAWSIEAYNDLQRERDGRWRWLRREFYVNTVAGTASYAYGSCTDTVAAAVIARFREWDLDEREPPLIYLVADGKASERELIPRDWPSFRYQFVRATHTADYPGWVARKDDGLLYLGPTPNDIYRVTGNYWRSNQTLAADADTPEMPVDYHMVIVYRALTKYGFNAVAPDVIARAKAEGGPLYEALSLNQGYARFSLTTAGPLA